MKMWRWTMALVAVGTLFAACTHSTTPDDEGSAGSGQTGHTTTTSSPGSTSSSPNTTSTTEPVQGVCGTELTYDDLAVDACVTEHCCSSFTPCDSDADCHGCLLGSGSSCDSNALYQAYKTCLTDSCPTDICGTGIGFSDQDTGEPVFACNACGASQCCSDLSSCVGDGSASALDLCIACLNAEAGCTDSAIQGYAQGFNTCISSSCANECG
jgi:hypothetical protein